MCFTRVVTLYIHTFSLLIVRVFHKDYLFHPIEAIMIEAYGSSSRLSRDGVSKRRSTFAKARLINFRLVDGLLNASVFIVNVDAYGYLFFRREVNSFPFTEYITPITSLGGLSVPLLHRESGRTRCIHMRSPARSTPYEYDYDYHT